MNKFLYFLLEIVRVLFILFFGLGLLLAFENWAILYFHVRMKENVFLPFLANVLLVFVAYRNWLQFHGWYPSQQMKRLPNVVTSSFILTAILLFVCSIQF
ncbi:hypothetical protein ACQCN2_03715 [Brevibacillus ginsengisoli]|uniref:hypothetical protein n=1 Tax=Brevibacillus ginsengisoli TaxID=363854 RepID=UPI003CF2E0EB